jgi:pyrroline-5-carboxylate reductase
MGSALARGLLRAHPDLRLSVYDKDPQRALALQSEEGQRVAVATDPAGVAASARDIVASVKPQDMDRLLSDLSATLQPGSVVVSTAAGVTFERLRASLGGEAGLARIMPNLAVGIGEGVVALAPEPGMPGDTVSRLLGLLGGLGRVELLAEDLFDAVTALTASGPGFLALALEGLEDGGVRSGLPRQVARVFAQQMALGAARLLLEEGLSPAALKDRVASPAGTTMAGLAVLEDRGVRGAFLRAVEAAAERGRSL